MKISNWLKLSLLLVFISTEAFAGFGLNLGYRNPRGSDVGLNFLLEGITLV